MSEFDIDQDALVESNPLVDRGQLAEARELVDAMRRSGFAPTPYRIDSPYERRPVERVGAPQDHGIRQPDTT